MKISPYLLAGFFTLLLLFNCQPDKTDRRLPSEEVYSMPAGTKTRWSSFENPLGEKGKGGMENKGGKGHPYDWIAAGAQQVLCDVQGSGTIRRIWITIRDRSPEMLRGLKIEMFWDGAATPAVSAPFGDFFGVGLGKRLTFENVYFSDPEGRSFNCCIPMPFRTAAKIVVTNESGIDLDMIFYDVNYTIDEKHEDNTLYFHTYWNREIETVPGKDFQILPPVKGKGRFLGTNIGVVEDARYKGYWWGEGEVKAYIDGDTDYPTLVGTGTEDYIGSAWGQGKYTNTYQGCLIAGEKQQWAFYRFHVPDPVYFYSDCKVTIQQMGGGMTDQVRELIREGVPLIPVTQNLSEGKMLRFLDREEAIDILTEELEDNWINFYRSDDVSATAYFYLDRPYSDLPEIQEPSIRMANLVMNE